MAFRNYRGLKQIESLAINSDEEKQASRKSSMYNKPQNEFTGRKDHMCFSVVVCLFVCLFVFFSSIICDSVQYLYYKTFAYTYICVCAHTYTHTHTHTHTHRHTQAHTAV